MPVTDVDQSGNYVQWARVFRGHSLGWQMVQIQPPDFVTVAGTTTLPAGSGIILVNVAGLVTLNLPSVAAWLQENANQPSNAFEGALWIKDYGGNAVGFNITVVPNGTDRIDNVAGNFTIAQARQLLRLYPFIRSGVTGWFSG